ncbi:MAG: hypothetical protein B7X04_03240 [Parcubacteria group bacterium 21-54-25]|nr:MAG: hypothetical protein B7X04_03240 [Parcubacteria group bacterium 21-54-25]HQU08003.1 hypothetical protein [Candidatus Paceibacterota bacterium]
MKTKSSHSDLDVLHVVYTKLYDFLEKLLHDVDVIEVTPARNAQYLAFANLIDDILSRPENADVECFVPFGSLLDTDVTEDGDVDAEGEQDSRTCTGKHETPYFQGQFIHSYSHSFI